MLHSLITILFHQNLVEYIFLIGADENAMRISFKSYKSLCITHSILVAEVIAFADLFDEALVVKDSIEMIAVNFAQLKLLKNS